MGGQKGWEEEKVKRNEREGVVVLVVVGGLGANLRVKLRHDSVDTSVLKRSLVVHGSRSSRAPKSALRNLSFLSPNGFHFLPFFFPT